MTDVELAYIAGIIDGEGYIGIKKSRAYQCQGRVNPGYHARIQIRMVDEPAIKFIAETLGGWYYKEPPRLERGRPLFCYQASDRKAEEILIAVLPYLRVKRDSAEAVLRLRSSQRVAKRTKVTGYRQLSNGRGAARTVRNLAFADDVISEWDGLYLKCKELNHVGVR